MIPNKGIGPWILEHRLYLWSQLRVWFHLPSPDSMWLWTITRTPCRIFSLEVAGGQCHNSNMSNLLELSEMSPSTMLSYSGCRLYNIDKAKYDVSRWCGSAPTINLVRPVYLWNRLYKKFAFRMEINISRANNGRSGLVHGLRGTVPHPTFWDPFIS